MRLMTIKNSGDLGLCREVLQFESWLGGRFGKLFIDIQGGDIEHRETGHAASAAALFAFVKELQE